MRVNLTIIFKCIFWKYSYKGSSDIPPHTQTTCLQTDQFTPGGWTKMCQGEKARAAIRIIPCNWNSLLGFRMPGHPVRYKNTFEEWPPMVKRGLTPKLKMVPVKLDFLKKNQPPFHRTTSAGAPASLTSLPGLGCSWKWCCFYQIPWTLHTSLLWETAPHILTLFFPRKVIF